MSSTATYAPVSDKRYARTTLVGTFSLLALMMGLSQLSFSSYAAAAPKQESHIVTHQQPFAVKLGASRVIYNPDSKGTTLTVSNPQDYPMLVQSDVKTEDLKGQAPFIVTPPLFRLDGNQQNRLRIVRTGGEFAADRESLNWLCVTGIPPEKGAAWAENADKSSKEVNLNVHISVNTCIKLLVRPSSLPGSVADAAGALTWTRDGKAVKVTNPTGYYINLSTANAGDKALKDVKYVAPFSDAHFTLPAGAGNEMKWRVITDTGGNSREYRAALK